MVCSVTTGSMALGMSSITRVRDRLQRCTGPPQQGQTSSRCSTFASIFAGFLRREPACPSLAPGFFLRRGVAGF
jgi:hypothetical protein